MGISGDDVIRTGNFFKVVDFYGLTGLPGTSGIIAPANWSASVEYTTTAPPPNLYVLHGDDAAVANLVFTYTGTADIVGGASGVTITGFKAVSTIPKLGATKDALGRLSNPSAVGGFVDSSNPVLVPVPEPTALISGGIGVLLLGLGYARRFRGQTTT